MKKIESLTKGALFTLLPALLAACSAKIPEQLAGEREEYIVGFSKITVSPPRHNEGKRINLEGQALAVFAELRNRAKDAGLSMNDCANIKVYLAADKDGVVRWKEFRTSFERSFGTPLVPHVPQLVQIEVNGFANPDQLILVEAEFKH